VGVSLKHLFLMSPSGKGTGGGLRWDLNTHAGHGNYFARPYPSFPGLAGESRNQLSLFLLYGKDIHMIIS
jgi:hypothetical protein